MISGRHRYAIAGLLVLAAAGLWTAARHGPQGGNAPAAKAEGSAGVVSPGAGSRRGPGAPAKVQPLPRSEDGVWDHCGNLPEFQKAYSGLLATKEGDEQAALSYLLIGRASQVLGLDDMEEFALGFNDVSTQSSAMTRVGEMAARELDPPALAKWVRARANDPSYDVAFGAIGCDAKPEVVPELIGEAANMKNKWLATHLLSGILGSGDAGSIKLAVEAFNKGYDGGVFGNTVDNAPVSLMEAGKVDEALDVCKLISKDQSRIGAYRRLLMVAAAASPSQAAEVFGRIPTEQERAGAVDALVSRWSSSNLQAASKWVAGLPSGIVRDKAAVAVSESVMLVSPREALTWADSVESEALRKPVVEKVIEHIKATDSPLWEQLSKGR